MLKVGDRRLPTHYIIKLFNADTLKKKIESVLGRFG
jgi:hypothetical protein